MVQPFFFFLVLNVYLDFLASHVFTFPPFQVPPPLPLQVREDKMTFLLTTGRHFSCLSNGPLSEAQSGCVSHFLWLLRSSCTTAPKCHPSRCCSSEATSPSRRTTTRRPSPWTSGSSSGRRHAQLTSSR